MTGLSAVPLEFVAVSESLHVNHSTVHYPAHSPAFQQQHFSTASGSSFPFNNMILYVMFVHNTHLIESIQSKCLHLKDELMKQSHALSFRVYDVWVLPMKKCIHSVPYLHTTST